MYNAAVVFDPFNGSSKRFSIPMVQELAAKQIQMPPQRYIRPEEERPWPPLRPNDLPQSEIPVIDMEIINSDEQQYHHCRQKEMEKLAQACQEWGFFQAVNHGIPLALTERMKGITREFFALPLEEKLQYEVQEVEGYGQTLVASDDQILDWADAVYLTTLPPENRKMKLWPTKPMDFRQTVDRYVIETEKLSHKILRVLAEGLGLKQEAFINMSGKIAQMMRLNYYPPCPRPDLVLGITPHSDGNGVTILLQDEDTVGLHIRKDGEWIPVHPIPNALVVNIGDMLEVMSNGRYKSIEHRAVTNMHRDRISIAMFYGPGRETEVGPAPELIDDLHPCQYRRFLRADYIRHFFSNKLDGKKKIEFVKLEPAN